MDSEFIMVTETRALVLESDRSTVPTCLLAWKDRLGSRQKGEERGKAWGRVPGNSKLP
jgi:hypothetical protein